MLPIETALSPAETEVFKRIVDRRTVRQGQLVETLSDKVAGDSLDSALKVLVDRNLVKVKPAIVKQFDTYLVTADGLELANFARL
jgi:hypothetical protein